LLRRLGFSERIRGSHHIFTREDVAEILNLQPKGAKAKPYQVKQVRGVIVRYRLGGQDGSV
jgi:predicted RNA binding protein YcfA (HicA-like mRNA interferase family)